MTFTEIEEHQGLKFEEDVCFTYFFLDMFMTQGCGVCRCDAHSNTGGCCFWIHRVSTCPLRLIGCGFGCLLGSFMDSLMHILYPCGQCMYGCECCKFYGCDNCTRVPSSYYAYWEKVEYEREWVLKSNSGYNRRSNRTNDRRDVYEKRTIRSTQVRKNANKDW